MENKPTVFIDTNVFLDYIQQRPVGFQEAFEIFKLAATDDIALIISDLTIANAKYCTRKDIPSAEFYHTLKEIRELFIIAPIGATAVDIALSLEPGDFEDALQYFSAVQSNSDYIVTRNVKDFHFTNDVEVITPKDFLAKRNI